MTEIEQAKNLLKQWNWRGITEDLDTIEEREAILQLESTAILLLTTIESKDQIIALQKEKIDEWCELAIDRQFEIHSQQEIITHQGKSLLLERQQIESQKEEIDQLREREYNHEFKKISDEQKIEKFKKLTTMQVKLNGTVSAATSLEMLAFMHSLLEEVEEEKKLHNVTKGFFDNLIIRSKEVEDGLQDQIELLNNETIELSKTIIDMNNKTGDLEQQLNHQKAITEQWEQEAATQAQQYLDADAALQLAVKGLKEIACLNVDSYYSAGTFARNTLSEIERLQK